MTFAEIAAALPKTAVTSLGDIGAQLSALSAQPKHVASGKVREIFDLGDALLLVATDRLSAFDVILPDGIPGKGAILTQMSNWWFGQTSGLIQNHLLPDQAGEFARRGIASRDLQLRSMIVRKLQPLAIECVARGYLIGSGWSSYQKTGEVCGIRLPAGLRQADKLPAPIFTPTTKAPKGQHDEPIDDARGAAAIGAALYAQVKAMSLQLYSFGHDPRATGRHDPRRHEVRIRHRRRGKAFPHRRSAHARLVALLAGRRVPPRLLAAELRQAVRARSPAGDQMEPAAAGAAPAGRRHRPHAGKISCGLKNLLG